MGTWAVRPCSARPSPGLRGGGVCQLPSTPQLLLQPHLHLCSAPGPPLPFLSLPWRMEESLPGRKSPEVRSFPLPLPHIPTNPKPELEWDSSNQVPAESQLSHHSGLLPARYSRKVLKVVTQFISFIECLLHTRLWLEFRRTFCSCSQGTNSWGSGGKRVYQHCKCFIKVQSASEYRK